MPKGRSFQSLALTAPSVNSGEIEGGFQVNGASGAENSFTVDGVVTNSLINGESRQDTVFEYLQEVQVKTGGISAEYGGALGGVISAVTKSGGNTFRGEGHYYYTGAATSAGPVKRLVLDPVDDITVDYFQDAKQPNNRHEVGGSLGGPIVRDKLFFFGSWSPRFVRRTNDYLFAGTETGRSSRSRRSPARSARSTTTRPTPAHQLLGALDADHVGRHAAGVQRRGAEHDLEQQGVKREPEDPRLRDPADQLHRQRWTSR